MCINGLSRNENSTFIDDMQPYIIIASIECVKVDMFDNLSERIHCYLMIILGGCHHFPNAIVYKCRVDVFHTLPSKWSRGFVVLCLQRVDFAIDVGND